MLDSAFAPLFCFLICIPKNVTAPINANPSGIPTPSPIARDLSTPPPPPEDVAPVCDGVLLGEVSDAPLLSGVDDRLVESEFAAVDEAEDGLGLGVVDRAEPAVELPPARNSVVHSGMVVFTLLETLQHE